MSAVPANSPSTNGAAVHAIAPTAPAGTQSPTTADAPHPAPVTLHPAAERVESTTQAMPTPQAGRGRKLLRRVLMLGGTVVVVGVASAAYLMGGRYVGTDDAYFKAATLSVTTDVSGIVQSVNVHEGQLVKKGDVLFRIDPQPFQIAVDNARAAMLQAELNVTSLKAAYRQALQQEQAQKAQMDVAKRTLDRYTALVKQGALARTTLDQQEATYLSSVATMSSLQQASAAALARLNGNADLPVDQFPDHMKAVAMVEEAQRQLDHTVVRAPFDGYVTGAGALQPGTLIMSAMSAFSTTSAVGLVSDKRVWIEAHMKETDLTRVHKGQVVDISVDTYPDCPIKGEVYEVAHASGSAFSPLPAENLSGNWVKVVQRIPVVIKIVKNQCSVPMSTGMSAVVSIDTGHQRWREYFQ